MSWLQKRLVSDKNMSHERVLLLHTGHGNSSLLGKGKPGVFQLSNPQTLWPSPHNHTEDPNKLSMIPQCESIGITPGICAETF